MWNSQFNSIMTTINGNYNKYPDKYKDNYVHTVSHVIPITSSSRAGHDSAVALGFLGPDGGCHRGRARPPGVAKAMYCQRPFAKPVTNATPTAPCVVTS